MAERATRSNRRGDLSQTGRLRQLRTWWLAVQWPFIGVLGLTALTLGVVGFLDVAGGSLALPDAFYRSVQLFVLESGAIDPPVPSTLQLARLLAPLVACYAAALALALLFRNELDRFRLRWLARGHVIVCGLGSKGSALACSLRSNGIPVGAIDLGDPPSVVRTSGVVAITGDATDPQVLQRAGLNRASRVVALCGSDTTNAAIAVAARDAPERRKPLVAHVQVDDPRFCTLLRTEALAAGVGHRRVALEFFTVYEQGARSLLDAYPFPDQGIDPPHLAVVGLGRFGRSLVAEIAQRTRYDPIPLTITIVDREADTRVATLLERFPGIAHSVTITSLCLDVSAPSFERSDFLLSPSGRRADAAYVCIGDESLALSAGLKICQRLKTTEGGTARPVDVVVRVAQMGGLTGLISDAATSEVARLRAFDLFGSTLNASLLMTATRDRLGEAIHGRYLATRLQEGVRPGSAPAMLPWDELGDEVREENRVAADAVGPRLRAVGCDLVPLSDWDTAPIRLTPAEVELLAVLEHRRWLSWKRDLGFGYGSPSDPERRLNEYLVPWCDLDEAARAWCRRFAEGLPTVLLQAGYRVVRLDRSLAHSLHGEYIRMRTAEGDTVESNPAIVPWGRLPEPLKASNRDQAADIRVKLLSIGCDVSPDTAEESAVLSDEEMERLAQREHARWVAQREADGWTFAPVKDVESRKTPYLVPWDELDEEVRDIDREFVRALPDLLDRVGLRIVRVVD